MRYSFSTSAEEQSMSEKTIEEKYKHAIIALQSIAQRDGSYENGVYNEWTEA